MVHKQDGVKTVELTQKGVCIGGRYEVLLCGSVFYFRLPSAVWRDRIRKLKAAGYNCADVYFPWNFHELKDGTFDFSGDRDVRTFLQIVKEEGLYVIARPGPYICSEWDGGSIPARILESGLPIRCADERFLSETRKWYDAILPVIAPYTYSNGGTVILLQLDNELDFFDCPDPAAYIGALRDMAEKYISGIPLFCCAGQYNVELAGGKTEGVDATLNCYPDSLDASFDGELQSYAFRFGEKKKPLLVSETNRDHFLLRRELSCGSKLVGAYNQVAGMNFGFHQAVNNWGSPDALIGTEYDFWSMIGASGAYTAEAEEAALFSAFLRTAGEPLAASLPERVSVLPSRCDFRTVEGGFRVLSLEGGGVAVCVPNFSEEKGTAEFTCNGHAVRACVPPARAPFFLFGLDLNHLGIPAVLTHANCEPIRASKSELFFLCEEGNSPEIGLDFGKGEVSVRKDGAVNGVFVKFLNRREAVKLITGEALSVKKPVSEKFEAFRECGLPEETEISAAHGTNFGALGISEGIAKYSVRIPAGEVLFVEHPCDFLRASADGVRGELRYSDGRDILLPPSKSGEYEIEAEKWGHSNFDDSQSPALRLSCKKGVLSFGAVVKEEKPNRFDFRLLERYGEEKIELPKGMPVRLSVDKWNSTRKPVICSYTRPVTRTADRLILKVTENCDVAVYRDGALLGECDYGTFELTEAFPRGEEHKLTLVYRKRVWTQNVGSVRLLHIDTVNPVHVRVLTEREFSAAKPDFNGKKVTLPLSVEREKAVCARVEGGKECFLRLFGKNLKVTCVADGRVIGRLILDWKNAPALHGGDHTLLYLCPVWSGEVYFYLESLGEGALFSGAELIIR